MIEKVESLVKKMQRWYQTTFGSAPISDSSELETIIETGYALPDYQD
jgi:hypothetical protein